MNAQPQITTSEIEEWENKFKETVSPLVKFDTDDRGNTSMRMYNGQSGVEASWSGTIILNNDNYIKWSFSIQNDPTMQSNITLTENNYNIISNLYHFYSNWKDAWSKQLSIPPDANQNDMVMQPTGNANSAPNTGITPELTSVSNAGTGAGAGVSLQESKRTKEEIIKNNKDRMKKLAGF